MPERERPAVHVVSFVAPSHAILALGLAMAWLGLEQTAHAQREPTLQAQVETPASVQRTTEEAAPPSDGLMAPSPTLPAAQQAAAGVAPSPKLSALADDDVDRARPPRRALPLRARQGHSGGGAGRATGAPLIAIAGLLAILGQAIVLAVQ